GAWTFNFRGPCCLGLPAGAVYLDVARPQVHRTDDRVCGYSYTRCKNRQRPDRCSNDLLHHAASRAGTSSAGSPEAFSRKNISNCDTRENRVGLLSRGAQICIRIRSRQRRGRRLRRAFQGADSTSWLTDLLETNLYGTGNGDARRANVPG